ncbi:MAG: 4Fe-4S dicluster domain-containing protein [Planctomycetaceae bacterium]|nr:4Fe-4S dicluster domain-containing protein [Planctomycetaceae bacterium]
MSTPSDSTSSNSPQPASATEEQRIGAGIPYGRFLDCVHCGLCTSACPTYLETGDENNSPRGRIYLMRAVTDGRLELTDKVQRHLDLCLDCRSCESACPSGVQYGRLIEPFRAETQQAERRKTGSGGDSWFQKYVMYGLFPYAGRMRWALWPARVMQRLGLDRIVDAVGITKLLPQKLKRMYQQLPRLQNSTGQFPEVLPAKGPKRARVALFTGCVADAMFGETNWATARVLQENGCEVVIPRTQNCCGAIHYHSGADVPAMQLARQNAKAFSEPDIDAVIINVAGCGSMLKDYGHIAQETEPDNTSLREELEQFAGKVQDVSEFLMKLGPIAPKGELKLRATYHDACHLAHAQKIREQPRSLLGLIPSLEIVPLAESEICCGAAGSYNLTEPEMSERLAQRKLSNILATQPQVVITSNAGCSLQIQASLKHAGQKIWVAHPMDLLDLSYRGIQPPAGLV